MCVFALALASGALADAPAPSEAQPGWLAPAPAFGRVVINEIMYNERKKPGEGSTSARATKRANLRRARARRVRGVRPFAGAGRGEDEDGGGKRKGSAVPRSCEGLGGGARVRRRA